MSAPIAPWRLSDRVSDAVVSDEPLREGEGVTHVDYYGGHLVAESIPARFRPLIAAAPDLLECLQNAAMHCSGERRARYLAAIAKASGGQA